MIGFTRVSILKKGLIFEKMTHSKPVWQLHLKATSINQLSPKSHKLFLQTQSKQAFIVVTIYKVIILRVEHFTRNIFRLMATNGRHLTCCMNMAKLVLERDSLNMWAEAENNLSFYSWSQFSQSGLMFEIIPTDF